MAAAGVWRAANYGGTLPDNPAKSFIMARFHFFTRSAAAGLAATLLANPAVAQSAITLTATGHTVTPATVYPWQPVQPPTAALPLVAGANQAWDFRALTNQGAAFTNNSRQVPPPNPAFPTATVGQRYLNSLGPLQVRGMQYNGYSAAGYVSFGSMLARQAFPIGSLTGSTQDSVVVLAQTNVYPQPQLIQALPATMGDVFARSSRTVTLATITVTAFGLTNAPVLYVQRYAEYDSVIAWGTLRVPVAGAGGGSAPIPVLLNRKRFVAQDSFYVNGQPAPAVLLGALMLTQGATGVFLSDNFLRLGSTQSVAAFNYPGTNRRQTSRVLVSTEAGLPLRAPALVAAADAALWPNPVAAGQALRVTISGLAEPVAAVLHDALGRTVYATTLRPGTDVLPLPAALAPGAYLLAADLPDGRSLRRRVVVE